MSTRLRRGSLRLSAASTATASVAAANVDRRPLRARSAHGGRSPGSLAGFVCHSPDGIILLVFSLYYSAVRVCVAPAHGSAALACASAPSARRSLSIACYHLQVPYFLFP